MTYQSRNQNELINFVTKLYFFNSVKAYHRHCKEILQTKKYFDSLDVDRL